MTGPGRNAVAVPIPARPHPFPLVMDRTALLVIDMQNDFLHPDGGCPQLLDLAPETLAAVRGIIPPVSRLLDWARKLGIAVVYTREASAPDLSDLSASKRCRYENAGYPVGTPGRMGRLLVRGEPGCAIIAELAPQAGDQQWDKPAQSAFVGTNLEESLQAQGVTHLLLSGVTTQCCVLATYRHAADLGFFPLLIEDCCAAFDPSEHAAAVAVLTSEGGAVGWVTASNHLFSGITAGRTP